jgi:hypothetical protein
MGRRIQDEEKGGTEEGGEGVRWRRREMEGEEMDLSLARQT